MGIEDRMNSEAEKTRKISVRNLVEFILSSGNIDNSQAGGDPDAMQEGSRLHKKIQKHQGSGYQAEVSLSLTLPVSIGGEVFSICVEGRADGILTEYSGLQAVQESFQLELEQTHTGKEQVRQEEKEGHSTADRIWALLKEDIAEGEMPGIAPVLQPEKAIDEIKCVYRELKHIQEIVPVHRAQALCYAYLYAREKGLSCIGIRLTYCNIETEQLQYFEEAYSFQVLERWYQGLLKEYGKWVAWQYHWKQHRDTSIKKLDFPFAYRPGQKELVAGVYRTILRKKKLFIEAPTGVGKTISTVFPSVRAMGEGKTEKIFYLTAKTITRTVAEDTFRLLTEQGLMLKAVTITAKEKICILEKPDCNPAGCERAKGHYDRINDAVFDMITKEERITRELIIAYAQKHQVCPFEMCLDLTTWADAVICDYNYVFDPKVYLRRFFQNEKDRDYVFLIDEAHNLVERAREMYSAALYKEAFQTAKQLAAGRSAGLEKQLEECSRAFLAMKRECEEFEVWENVGSLVLPLMRVTAEFDEFFPQNRNLERKEELISLYLEIRHFLNIYDILDENYMIYTDYSDTGQFRIKLMCMDPSVNLKHCLEKGRSAVFFSATLLPIRYYKEQLGGNEEDYAVYAPSPFQQERRLLMVARDVSTKYTRRTDAEYAKILAYIERFTKAKTGNYLVFFPSYQMLNQIAEMAAGVLDGLVLQTNNMKELEKEEFLNLFESDSEKTRIGFCVMGGIFSEGIDLTKDRLIGAVIVGTGLPMVCNERELFRGFYDQRNQNGFEYAYLYPGMNKVLQSAGRVIRTSEDYGAVLLLDERFLNSQYQGLFPREWFPYKTVGLTEVEQKLNEFWSKYPSDSREDTKKDSSS